MKRLITFSLILLNSFFYIQVKACWFYPESEDVAIRLLTLKGLNIKGYNAFTYSCGFFTNDEPEALKLGELKNLKLWKERCKNIPTFKDINEIIYGDKISISKSSFKNTFVNYLYKRKDLGAINYLIFAKKVSIYNKTYTEDDPWEMGDGIDIPHRSELIEEALKNAKSTKDSDLKIRYAFLAIRLAYYDNNMSLIETIYDEYFKKRKRKNIIDYWGMYFRTFVEESPNGYRNYLASIVFSNAEDKRYMSNNKYNKYKESNDFSTNQESYLNETLPYAKNKSEKAAIWLLEGIETYGKAIQCIKKLYQIAPDNDGLNILLFREISKLEEWIFTPNYSNFTPGDYNLSPSPFPDNDNISSSKFIKKRLKIDREYAKKLLQFVQTVNIKKVSNPIVWEISKADLLLMTGAYNKAINLVDSLLNVHQRNNDLISQLNRIKSISLVAKQPIDSAIIPEDIKPVLMSELTKKNNDFIFIIAKELEFKHNTTDAAILLYKLKDNETYGRVWKTKTEMQTLWDDYYYNAFFYMDAVYTNKQIQDLISEIENNRQSDVFSKWKFSTIIKDKSILYDLLGTKFLRKDLLEEALNAFKKVDKKVWFSEKYSYKDMLNVNSFYTDMYNEHSKTEADSIKYTKVSLIRKLIQYKNKANNVKTRNRSYYYFLVANCYLNMSYYGNSWYMKRYCWSANRFGYGMEDDKDYFNCEKAKKYYLLAKKTSRNKKFAALSLRMVARCESYNNKEDIIYAQLKKQYPDDYEELAGNCMSFETYFKMHD